MREFVCLYLADQLDVPVVALHDAVVVLVLAYAQAVAVAQEIARVL